MGEPLPRCLVREAQRTWPLVSAPRRVAAQELDVEVATFVGQRKRDMIADIAFAFQILDHNRRKRVE